MNAENNTENITSTQQEMPFAIVQGAEVTEVPKDLYIPPEALEVFLEAFEGPLDLLLYLIKKQNLEILDIPVSEITRQYVEYIDLMDDLQLELAAEYLVMAAMLAEIKSRMLLPRIEDDNDNDEAEDPRAELVRRLQEYERYKKAAEDIDAMPRMGRDTVEVNAIVEDKKVIKLQAKVEMRDLLLALKDVIVRAETFAHHKIELEPLSVRERMSIVLDRVNANTFTNFVELFDPEEGKSGIVVTLLAILELIKQSTIEFIQTETFGPIHVKAKSNSVEATE
ncbi:Segregation and condensation protein A [hydrothermal vent metagenome]|uniref:Segregation and condensation protein A n=1 Tax=hydrothermal vent metagenome TaxID=652676 RepID=A0A3B1AMV3_9ZZZZ